MNLTLIAEVLAGETTITPGGAVDTVTARGLEPFLWDRWAVDLYGQPAMEDVELIATAPQPVGGETTEGQPGTVELLGTR